MPQILIKGTDKIISVAIPLTANSGKIRIKNRSILNEYGITFATKQTPFKLSNYVEWMIGYDVIKKDTTKLSETTLPETKFTGANTEIKALYELSEYIYYFKKWNIITEKDLTDIENYLNSIIDDNLLDNNAELKISRDNFSEKTINGIKFKHTLVKYPLLVKEFGNFEIISEIKITEQQRAMATQPMLYLCFPITELRADSTLVGRTAEAKELAYFDITKDNVAVFLEALKMFGILSESHKHDVLEIIKIIKSA
jgi:hypothetical protein